MASHSDLDFQNKTNDLFIETLGRHFVLFVMMFRRREKAEPGVFTATTFLVNIKEKWFLVTAGHVVKEIKSIIGNPEYFSFHQVLFDALNAQGVRFPVGYLPFYFDFEKAIIFGDETSDDFALIPLSDLFAAQLKAANMQPLSYEPWDDGEDTFDSLFLLGTPKSSIKVNYVGETTPKVDEIYHELQGLLIEPLYEKPVNMLEYSAPRFYGKISTPLNGDNIEGMSGGPILGFRQQENNRPAIYKALAVQSTWNPGSLTISACPLSRLKPLIGAKVAGI